LGWARDSRLIEHHCERRQGEGGEQTGAALGETAGAGRDPTAPQTQRAKTANCEAKN
jgi:hypothetical protein